MFINVLITLCSALSVFLTMKERGQDGIENQIKIFAHILRQESQYEISVLLQQGIFAPIPAVRFGVGQMLRAVQLDDDARLRAQEIHLHSSPAVKTDRQLDVKAKSALRSRQCFQSAKQERFAGASRAIGSPLRKIVSIES